MENQSTQVQTTDETSHNQPVIQQPKSKKNIWIILAILGTVLIASFLYLNKSSSNRNEQSKTTPTKATKPTPIKSTVKSSFAEYKPYTVDITPNADSYSLPVSLDKTLNKNHFKLDNYTTQKLTEQGFAAIPSNYDQLYSIYKINTKNARPNFVTTDSVLHTYHVLYDYTLRNLEINKFIPDLKNLNKVMLENSLDQYNSVNDPNLKLAAKKNVAYFAVASKLLDPNTEIPSAVKDTVEQELQLISNHSGFQISPIFGYKEDYSQYVPRGHYTRNENFKNYFKAMMWYGRIMFRVEPPAGIMGNKTDKEKGREETREALLISLLLNKSKVGQEDALTVWDKIYQPTVFFVGRTDDYNVYDYLAVIKDVFGEQVVINDLADDNKIDQITTKLITLPTPKISASSVLETEDAAKVTRGFRFMGQRFVPDSYIFQQLVFPKVQDYTGNNPKPFTAETIETLNGTRTVRAFPRGLDVAAVLGSQRAKYILDKQDDSAFKKYDEQFNKLKQEFSSLPKDQWTENLYWNWLYSLLPTLTVKGNGYPIFMQQEAWQDKDVNSFLGSWMELRHDTILYAKQSYTGFGTTSVTPTSPKPEDRGYVEPNAEVYARLASLAKFMREGLESRNLLDSEYKSKLTKMENVLLILKGLSEKELTNQALQKEDYDFIKGIGSTLEDLVTFSTAETKKITSDTDTKMEIVADVHTDGNTYQVLEEGVGKPLNLLVVVKESGDLYLTSGAIFSYYEFKHPMSDRLTDEKWQEMTKPPLPKFTETFVGQ